MKDPPSRNAFMPRAEPATILGPCEHITGASWTFQHGKVKARTNIQPQGMTDDDIAWVKVHLSDWDPPEAPLPLLDIRFYDAASLTPVEPVSGGATRDIIVCLACLLLV